MKEIIGQYGAVLIGVLVLVSILALMSGIRYKKGTGVGGTAGQLLSQSLSDTQEEDQDNQAYANFKSQVFPTIHQASGLCTGRDYLASDCFSVTYEDGSQGEYQVYCIKLYEGMDFEKEEARDVTYLLGASKLHFDLPGIYEIYVKLYNASKEQMYSKFYLLVNQE